ncbi:hypothetical protein Hydth_0514 [Hydrogenobacter thermophilus TK-6]|uniref:Uncharacterized protein n=1 Tax=Hydrogenobacter thermophilus (strain DSM 6534 / IAM 12695 / TK-6) TaxID=608538 RepID=D3DGM8_HYDTT|nr:hypothetical protein [Hydrogenobacter thermophilus]ADO44914.1 hypothetical protein Hydth_0514 [Hydrogenobacter thermophilus TK-6]BAI68980.1 hypothetical protein HTH_0516 [Hydrogenobacter thermophilus TK-6]
MKALILDRRGCVIGKLPVPLPIPYRGGYSLLEINGSLYRLTGACEEGFFVKPWTLPAPAFEKEKED